MNSGMVPRIVAPRSAVSGPPGPMYPSSSSSPLLPPPPPLPLPKITVRERSTLLHTSNINTLNRLPVGPRPSRTESRVVSIVLTFAFTHLSAAVVVEGELYYVWGRDQTLQSTVLPPGLAREMVRKQLIENCSEGS